MPMDTRDRNRRRRPVTRCARWWSRALLGFQVTDGWKRELTFRRKGARTEEGRRSRTHGCHCGRRRGNEGNAPSKHFSHPDGKSKMEATEEGHRRGQRQGYDVSQGSRNEGCQQEELMGLHPICGKRRQGQAESCDGVVPGLRHHVAPANGTSGRTTG
jgi:hypothetical protein